jgi:flagellar L-ring protein FlgH
MTRRDWVRAWLFGAFLTPVTSVQADSIWERREHQSAFLFIDNRARRVGDLLTVVVKESTGARNNEERKLDKSTTASGKANFSGKTGSDNASRGATASVGADQSSDRSFLGSAGYESDRTLLDQMTVTVTDILPNGNLVIEGYRRRVISNETRLLRVTGIVRPNDIEAPNVIESKYIANFHISYEGAGVETRFTNQGWLGRATNRLWPH